MGTPIAMIGPGAACSRWRAKRPSSNHPPSIACSSRDSPPNLLLLFISLPVALSGLPVSAPHVASLLAPQVQVRFQYLGGFRPQQLLPATPLPLPPPRPLSQLFASASPDPSSRETCPYSLLLAARRCPASLSRIVLHPPVYSAVPLRAPPPTSDTTYRVRLLSLEVCCTPRLPPSERPHSASTFDFDLFNLARLSLRRLPTSSLTSTSDYRITPTLPPLALNCPSRPV